MRLTPAQRPLPVAVRSALAIATMCCRYLAIKHGDGATAFHGDLLTVACVLGAASLFLGLRVAIQLTVFTALASLLFTGEDVESVANVGVVVAFASIALVVVVFQRRLFPPAPRAVRSTWSDALVGIRVTLFMFLALEVAASLAFHTAEFQRLRMVAEPEARPRRPPVPGRPTLSTLGSSPANLERVHDRPFTAILGDRFADRVNFVSYKRGGVNSTMLVAIARSQEAWANKPDGFIVYCGLQDYNAAAGVAFLREVDVLGRSGFAAKVAREVIRQSKGVRLALFLMKQEQYERAASASIDKARAVLRTFSLNLETIIDLAAANQQRMFVVTVSANLNHREYLNLLNDYLRSLPARYPHVTLVDFAAVIEAKYPSGRLADCEPYEPVPNVPGQCGDPYHLGPKGHELLAETLAPPIEQWAASRGAAGSAP